MTEQDFEDLLLEVVQTAEDWVDTEARPERVQTFEQAAVLSGNRGLVVRMDDGSEFQVTIVKTA